MNQTDPGDDRTDRLANAHADLVTAIESLTTSEDWLRMLTLASRFYRYSTNNVFLIMLQRPEATRVAGYRAWQAMGRQVRKGESGIRIFAPCIYRGRSTESDKSDATSVGLRGFKTATVFDISQTEGEDLPDVRPVMLDGDGVAGLWAKLSVQVEAAGYAVERGDCDGANGRTDHSAQIVRVRDDVSKAQAAKTLAHELAHVLLHPDTAGYFRCRGRAEVEAESTAFLVCRVAGLTTDGYSWPYIAHWSDGSAKMVQDAAGRVLEAARSILVGIETDASAS